jgi:hypothetical protein
MDISSSIVLAFGIHIFTSSSGASFFTFAAILLLAFPPYFLKFQH